VSGECFDFRKHNEVTTADPSRLENKLQHRARVSRLLSWVARRRKESHVPLSIPEFGIAASGVAYVLRPGGYAVLFSATGEVATVSTPLGLALPGGGQDEGERPEDAAIREVEEECGLRIVLGPRLGVADELVFAADEGKHYRKRCTFFLGEVIGTSGTGEPDHELLWLSPQDAMAMLLHESQRWAVSEACHRRNRRT
jgi:8-oxo-dGTP pyrophosphatase MutT (NUDIX family)